MAGRVRNYLAKETDKSDFPIRLQMLDVRAMDYQAGNRNRRMEPCVSLKVHACCIYIHTPENIYCFYSIAHNSVVCCCCFIALFVFFFGAMRLNEHRMGREYGIWRYKALSFCHTFVRKGDSGCCGLVGKLVDRLLMVG